MNGFLDLHRTDGRTNGGDLIGPNRSAGDQKILKQARNAEVSRRRPNSKLEQKQTKEYLTTFLGQNNINNEFRTIKLVKMQIFSQNEQS